MASVMCREEKTITRQEKLSAISTLLLEMTLLVFIAFMVMLLLGIVSTLAAHFIFGTSWTWGLFFWVLAATPLLPAGGAVWVVLRNEYRRILQIRMRKW